MKKITTFLTLALLAGTSWQMSAQNGGADCASAVAVTEGAVTATTIPDTTAGTNNGDSAWFVYTATGDGTINVNSCLGGADTRLFIWNDCADGAAAANNDDACQFEPGSLDWASQIEEFDVVNGEDYFIQWDDRWSVDVPFNWSITFTPAPDCPDVENITSATNTDTSVSLDWDDATGATGYNYELQPVGVAQGTAGALVMDTSATSDATIAAGVLTDGESYTLYVQSDCGGGTLGAYQSIDINYALPPANDNCDGIIDLDNETSPLSGTTVAANNDFVLDCITNEGSPDVLYSVTVPDGFILTFQQLENSYDSEVRIAYGPTCPGDTVIVCYDDPDTGIQEWTNDTGAEVEVYFLIGAFSTGSGTFTIEWSVVAPPSCPDVENITTLTNGDGSVALDWDDITDVVGYNYEVQPVGVAQGTAGALVMDSSVTSDVTIATGVLTDGDEYTLYVQSDCDEGVLGNFQSIDFTYIIPPANDACEDAIAIDCDETATGSTAAATDSGGSAAPDVWYSYSGGAGTITVSLCDGGTDYDSRLRIFDACDGNEIVQNDDFCGLQSELSFIADGTSTYFIMVEGFAGGSFGNYSLAITCEIDEVECEAPENVMVSNILDTTADITWDEAPTALVGYQVGVFLQGDDPLNDNPVYFSAAILPPGTTSDSATGLEAEVAYDAYVASVCDLSDLENPVFALSGPVTFNTILDATTFDTVTFTATPNPTDGLVSIRTNVSVESLEVYNLLGQVVLQKTPNATDFILDVSDLQSGTYFVKATADGVTTTHKLVRK